MFYRSESYFIGSFQHLHQNLQHIDISPRYRLFPSKQPSHKPFVSRFPTLLSTYNPNDNETPEEQKKRMEKVRQIQANFYKSSSDTLENDINDKISTVGTENNNKDEEWLQTDSNDCAILHNVPLWRVQWVELPGLQNVLNVHVAHYTHMFLKIIYECPKPWLYGHVYLPDGSENLGNPDYFLNPDQNKNNVTYTGTLMQITDFKEQEDGRLTLVVQALERMTIVGEAKQHVPYAVASKIQIDPDMECFETYCLRLAGNSSLDYELFMAYARSCQSMVVKEVELLRDYEFRKPLPVELEEQIVFLSPLSQVNASTPVDYANMNGRLLDSFQKRLRKEAEEKGIDELLLLTSDSSGLTKQLQEILEAPRNRFTFVEVAKKEREVWIQIDAMLKAFQKLQPELDCSKIIPVELLSLLPEEIEDWPKGFQITKWAKDAGEKSQYAGSSSTEGVVPFVRLDESWPQLRRAGRLSYLVWLLLETTVGGGGIDGEHRNIVLETSQIDKRLQMVIEQLTHVTMLIEDEKN